jgi:hypothetical protein
MEAYRVRGLGEVPAVHINALVSIISPVVLLENVEVFEEMRVIVVAEFSLPMQLSLATLFVTLSSIFRSHAVLELENLALRHQIGILQRSARKRPKLTPWDRLLWVWFSRIWSDWRSALAIVKPETVVAWHRAGAAVADLAHVLGESC